MGKAIESLRNGQIVGHVGLGMYGENIGSVKQQVYDGDTIIVRALGNFSIRFLGIDTAEKKIPLPGEDSFTSLSDPRWDAFLTNPFAPDDSPYSAGLTDYILNKLGPGVAKNHKQHADAAEDQLEEFVQDDLTEMNVSKEDFEFYLRFAFEIMDGYGRFLCYINRDQPDANNPTPRPYSYNTRLLINGMASPYFIWPNINPWRAYGSIVDAVLAPGTANDIAQDDNKLRQAREAIKNARQNEVGIFDGDEPLRIEPFEVRYLSRNSPPSRWVIDLSKNDNILIHPENYYTIPFGEDRLYIPSEYVPLFVEAGWQKEVAP
jgi:endonuclease YncB( thermonuclease family)